MKFPINSPIKRLSDTGKKVFLTFDDGPVADFTPKILDMLKKNNVPATFFLVTNKALEQPQLVKKIISEGHSIGDHSLDHKYSRYFSSLKNTKDWIKNSQKTLEELISQKPVAFRSPAGVWTPKLALALKELQIPWVHWNIRFFDTNRTFTKKQIDRKISKIKEGSIILLHDLQEKNREATFLESLSYLIEKVKSVGFGFEKL